MRDYSIKDFSDFIYEKLEDVISNKPVLSNPNTESKFPLIELHTPLKSIIQTNGGFPVLSSFQISITCWAEKQREAMDITNSVDEKLIHQNILRVNTNEAVYNTITQKYGITVIYETKYNAIIDAFIKTK